MLCQDSSLREITNVGVDRREVRVYNIEVADEHTYFVGESKVLVHNKGGDDDDGPTVYPHEHVDLHVFYRKWKSAYYHCGVPAWKEGVDEDAPLHFGEIPDLRPGDEDVWSKYGIKKKDSNDQEIVDNNPFRGKYNLYTYNPTKDGIYSFEFPFVRSSKGVLSSFWSGNEPVCETLSHLLNDGLFYRYPYHDGIGYMFRKNVSRLIFVFSDEFDNSYARTFSATAGTVDKECVLIPVATKSTVKMVVCEKAFAKNAPEPLDPFCLQILRSEDTKDKKDAPSSTIVNKIKEFALGLANATSSGVDQSTYWSDSVAKAALESMFPFRPDKNLRKVSTKSKDKKYQVTSLNKGSKLGNQKISYGGSMGGYDLTRTSKPFGSWLAKTVLSDVQQQELYDYGYFLGVDQALGTDKKWNFDYYAAKTVGFYKLRHNLLSYPDSFNLFMFVGDASAPRKLYEPDDSLTDQAEKNKNLGESMYMYQSEDKENLFSTLNGDITVDGVVDSDGQSKSVRLNMTQLANLNAIYLGGISRSVKYRKHKNSGFNVQTANMSLGDANALNGVFGLENPHYKNSIVLGYRRDIYGSQVKKASGTRKLVLGIPHDYPFQAPDGIFGLLLSKQENKHADRRNIVFTWLKDNLSAMGTRTWTDAMICKALQWVGNDFPYKSGVPNISLGEEESAISDAEVKFLKKHLAPRARWGNSKSHGYTNDYDENDVKKPAVLDPDKMSVWNLDD